MGNKYQSKIVTVYARNLVWKDTFAYPAAAVGGVAPNGLYTMQAPANFNILKADCVEQVFDFNGGNPLNRTPYSWLYSSFAIKSVGLFSNFADGLVYSDITNRLTLEINIYKTDQNVANPQATSVVMTKDSNLVTGTNLNNLDPGSGKPIFLCNSVTNLGMFYTLSHLTGVGGTSARLSGYALDTINANQNLISVLETTKVPKVYTPTLNTLFQMEQFVPSTINQTDSVNIKTMVTAKLVIDKSDSFDFYTPVIDTGFNDLPVTFDAVMELEITPD
jgi:hypothetical protein